MQAEVPLLLMLFFVAALAGCSPAGGGEVKPAAPGAESPLEFAPADLASVAAAADMSVIAVAGEVAARNQSVVRAETEGLLSYLAADEGRRFERGQVIARLDPGEFEAKLREREALLASADVEFKLALEQLEKQKALLASGFISETAFTLVDSSAAAKQAAKAAAAAQLEQARIALQRTQVRAPISGVIARRHVGVGEMVTRGAQIATIVDLAQLELVVTIAASDVDRVRPGTVFRFVPSNARADIAGSVDRLAPSAEGGSRSFLAYVRLMHPPRDVRPGVYLRGELLAVSTGAATVVPLAALRSDAGQDFVLAIENDRIVRHSVKVLRRDPVSATAELAQPLDTRLKLITTRHPQVVEGRRARQTVAGA